MRKFGSAARRFEVKSGLSKHEMAQIMSSTRQAQFLRFLDEAMAKSWSLHTNSKKSAV